MKTDPTRKMKTCPNLDFPSFEDGEPRVLSICEPESYAFKPEELRFLADLIEEADARLVILKP